MARRMWLVVSFDDVPSALEESRGITIRAQAELAHGAVVASPSEPAAKRVLVGERNRTILF